MQIFKNNFYQFDQDSRIFNIKVLLIDIWNNVALPYSSGCFLYSIITFSSGGWLLFLLTQLLTVQEGHFLYGQNKLKFRKVASV